MSSQRQMRQSIRSHWRQRDYFGFPSAAVGDLHDLHHTQLLVVHHVAVQHVFPREIEESRAEGDAASMSR